MTINKLINFFGGTKEKIFHHFLIYKKCCITYKDCQIQKFWEDYICNYGSVMKLQQKTLLKLGDEKKMSQIWTYDMSLYCRKRLEISI